MRSTWFERAPGKGQRSEAGGRATLVDRVLAARGIAAGAAAEFLSPDLGRLHEPSLMHDMDRAAERLIDALRAREPIAIYGDYDVDGITATAILFHMLRALEPRADVRTYVPDRLNEGYGLNSAALLGLAAAGAKVIVSVDCGVSAVEPARALREAVGCACDLIITDHHRLPEGELPRALAIVHPGLGEYPDRDLCAAGVAYKLAWRLATMWCRSQRVSEGLRALLVELLGLAAMGTIADVVPLTGENRVLVWHGLRRLRRSRLPGIEALIVASRLDGEHVREEEVGFRIAPRLNAGGRMDHAREAVELLTVAESERGMEIASSLDRLNGSRRRAEQGIVEEAFELARAAGMDRPERRAVVLAHDEWSPGVVGIACSRVVERLHRPTLLMGRSNGVWKGSGRSTPGFDLYEALRRCEHLLLKYGGHAAAAGFAVEAERVGEFTEAFIAVANEMLGPEELFARTEYDTTAALGEVTMAAAEMLEALAPFGRGNPKVRLRIDNLRLDANAESMGEKNQHLRMRAVQGTRSLRMVGWGMAELGTRLRAGTSFDAVVSPRINEWGGRRSVEAELVDFSVRG